MLNKEQFAQQALKLLGKAQNFEENGDLEKAIEMYQESADYLKNSGIMMERISDIYARIEELKQFRKEKLLYQKAQKDVEIEKLQEEAFSLLDGASKSEASGFFETAIQQYESAIKLLSKAGWIESQIQNLRMKIAGLKNNIELRKKEKIQKSQESSISEQETQVFHKIKTQPQVTDAFGRKKDLEQADKVQKYKELKKQEEQIQNDAFSFIDNAKFYERDGEFEKAIESYGQAIELLKSIGWQDQMKNIQIIIERLKRQKIEFEKMQKTPLSEPIMPESAVKSYVPSEVKQDEDLIQTQAFNLIDMAKKLEREKKYDKAISKFQSAIELFKKIEWDSYIQPLLNFIKDIRDKQQKDVDLLQLKEKREKNIEDIQNTVFMKEIDQFVETSKDLESKRLIYEKNKREQEKKEKEFFAVLEKADKKLQEDKDFNAAIKEYYIALELLNTLGSSWESYTDTIKTTINTIKNLKEQLIEKDFEIKRKEEVKKKEELSFQQKILSQLQVERKKIKDKELKIELKEDELKYIEQRKQSAFDALDEAQKFIMQGDLDNAIFAYQTAGNIFAVIQWNDELPLIEDAIHELEDRKRQQELNKQKKLEKSIQQFKEEQKFQALMAKKLASEREALREKQIVIKEQKKELEYREQRRKEAFRILEESEIYLGQGDYEKVLEQYNTVANIFAEIQWYDEVELVGTAIIEIENKKRQQELEKQREMERLLENEQKERAFQMTIAKAMEEEKRKYRQRQLILKEKEKESQIIEERKEKGFSFLDQAQNYLSLGKFDLAIDEYREAAKIFAQIGWRNEIPLIMDSIQKIEAKKKEKEIWKQQAIQKSLKEEQEAREFMAKIVESREMERKTLEAKQIELEEEKKISTETKAQEDTAFQLIEQADMYLTNEKFDQALELYEEASSILNTLGWTKSYLTLLQDSIQKVKSRKIETEERKRKERQNRIKKMEEDRKFELKIYEQLENEKERLKAKKIEIQKREVLLREVENLKEEAFSLMDKAELLLNQGLYDQSIELYHQAEMVLSEIQFPTDPIRGMIDKIKSKKREDQLSKQYEMEMKQKKLVEEQKFQEEVTANMKLEAEKMQEKEIKLREREELRSYMETRKQDAFDLLEQAESFLRLGQYEKSLEYYRSAELILNEIRFPTDSLKETILKVLEKQKQKKLDQQLELERRLQREKEERKFKHLISENLSREKERIKTKKVEMEKLQQLKFKVEENKERAFEFLDKAEINLKNQEYDNSIENYRKAMTILNEIQFPTNIINDMIFKVMKLKKDQAIEKEGTLRKQLEKMEEERKLNAILEERKQQEITKKVAQQLAIQERENVVEKQLNYREAAYSLLDEAGKFLKIPIPDYDKAISLYIQSRDLLQEKIGWEPEINNLNVLIKDLIQEREKLAEKKRLEEEIRLKRQREYELFQEEIKKRKDEYLRQKREQQEKTRQLLVKRQLEKQTSEEGLSLLDQARNLLSQNDFDGAIQSFQNAIKKFNEIGWNDQILYIKEEIENIKKLHQKFLKEELEIQKLHEELKLKKEFEEERLLLKEKQIQKSVGEVGDLTGDISNMISDYKKQAKLREKTRKESIKSEAKEFSKSMGKMIQLKQDLKNELTESKRSKERKKEEEELAKDKEKADEIKKMLKDMKKK